MYIYIYLYVYIYISRLYTYICSFIYTHIWVYLVELYIHNYMHNTYIVLYICIYIYICIYVLLCIYIYICIHTIAYSQPTVWFLGLNLNMWRFNSQVEKNTFFPGKMNFIHHDFLGVIYFQTNSTQGHDLIQRMMNLMCPLVSV